MFNTTLVFSVAILFATPAYSMSATLKDNTPACLNEKWIEDMTSFVTAKDKTNVEAYTNQSKCIIIKSGATVTVIESPWVFGKYTSFIYNDVTYWATTDSFNYDK